jgi:PA14 domain
MSTGRWCKICCVALFLLPARSALAATTPLLSSHHLLFPAATPLPTQQPIPDSTSQQNALDLIQSTFKSDYADATPHGRAALAQKLLQQADATNDNPPGQFTLLLQSAEAAIPSGEAKTLTQAIDGLARHFAVDGIAMKTRAYRLIAPSCWTPIQAEELADGCASAIDQAIAADEYDNAVQLQSVGQAAANRSGQLDSSRRFQQLRPDVLDIRQQFAAAKLALNQLQVHPDNAHACTIAGRFLCFAKADWNAGLPVMAHGDDAALAAASKADLSTGQDVQAIARTADAWWEISRKLPALEQQHAQKHAVDKYRQVVAGLNGLSQTVAAQRLADFDNAQIQQMHLSPGLAGQLFEDKDFSQPNTARVDTQIDFEWGHQPAAPTMPKEDFSIRWTGKLRSSQPGLYTLALQANEGAKVLLDGKPILENAVGVHRHAVQKINLQLDAGVHDFQLDYWAGSGMAKCKLLWIAPGSLALVPIPPDAFYHDQDNSTP